ncbi:MAG: hypothetical protein ACP5E5_06120 [Acidobacteriaceae bacterium]
MKDTNDSLIRRGWSALQILQHSFSLRGSGASHRQILRLCVVLGMLFPLMLIAQMVNPAIDAGSGPFSYYSHPTDVIGVMDAPDGTLVSPEGYLYTGYGELMFFTGDPAIGINQRVKTLLDGYQPVILYSFERDGIRYEFTDFAATLDGTSSGQLVDFVRVRIQNENAAMRTAVFSAGMRYEGEINTPYGVPDNRYRRPVTASHLGGYNQIGVTYDPNWKYSADNGTVQRDGQVLYYFPNNAPHVLKYTLKPDGNESGMLKPKALRILPTTPVGIVQYRLTLKPGEATTLDFKLPVVPVPAGSTDATKIASASFDTYLPQTTLFWDRILRQGTNITVPEAKVNNTFKVSLIYDLIAREKIGDNYIQTVNDFHYHAFWLRDASFIVRMYDVTGYPKFAQQDLDFFKRWQQPDGNFVSQGGQFDGVGQVLWAYGEHYRITHDRAFAEQVFPAVVKAVAWITQARQSDPLHLLPTTRPGDNENITGHVTGHNFWALDGLKNAVVLAKATGHEAEAQTFQHEYDDYLATFLHVLDNVTKKTDGYIPPGLDGQHGQDWGNMLAIYPGIVLDPNNPMVTATLDATRAKYREGIMTYDDEKDLHDYLAFSNTETELIRDQQELAIKDLYAELVHTSSTHAGFETDIPSWGDRDFEDNLTPHGWFAARLRICLRNMMVREQGHDLHLFSAISPAWIGTGDSIEVNQAPTNFGVVTFSLKSTSSSHADLHLDSSFVDPPQRIILHLPWFMKTTKVTADGKTIGISGDKVVLPVRVRDVSIDWTKRADSKPLSYDLAVSQYKAEYAARYQRLMQTGKQ